MAILRFFKMAVVRHLGFVVWVGGPPTQQIQDGGQPDIHHLGAAIVSTIHSEE